MSFLFITLMQNMSSSYSLEITFLIQTKSEPSYDLLKICTELAKMSTVEYAEPNLVTSAVDFQINPTDFLYAQQWHIPLINLPNAWKIFESSGLFCLNWV